jgi:hypothetical protein
VGDAVLSADPIEQHLTATLAEPGGELLPVVRENLVGDAVGDHGLDEGPAHRPPRGLGHDLGDHSEPRVVVDLGDQLEFPAVGEEHRAHDVELPQLHRHRPFPPLIVLPPALPRCRRYQAMAHEDPIHRRP